MRRPWTFRSDRSWWTRKTGACSRFPSACIGVFSIPLIVIFSLLFIPSVLAVEATDWPIPSGAVPAQVLFVYDGDTIDVRLNGERVRVRYIGIDAPELFSSDVEDESLGREAWAANKALVLGRTVYIETDAQEHDVYGRLLAYVYVEPAVFVNAWLVEQGFARAWTIPPNDAYASDFHRLQQQAMQRKRGLWVYPEFADITRGDPIKEET